MRITGHNNEADLRSVSGVFITKGDVGVGTIVGSAVFNILCIIGVCGLFAGQVRPAVGRGMGSEGTAWRWGPVAPGSSDMGSHTPVGCPTGTGNCQAPLFGLHADGLQNTWVHINN